MTFHTAVFDAQTALVALLQGSTLPGDGWTIGFGFPSKRPGEKQIWVDEKVTNWTQDPIGTGDVVLNQEDFRLDVWIYHRHTTNDAALIASTIKAAADTVSHIVGTTPFLGGAVADATFTNAEYDGAIADPNGRQREGALRITFACISYPTSA